MIRRFKAGDEVAFTAIYDQFYFVIYQYAKRWLYNKQEAEDVTSETFTKLWHRREQMENLENITGFLKVTARNACINILKHDKVKESKRAELLQQLSLEADPDLAWAEIREEFLQLIYAEVQTMPEKMREIFLLAYKEGLKPAEIARQLDLNVQTVSNQKSNAVKLLKAALRHKSLFTAFLLFLENGHL